MTKAALLSAVALLSASLVACNDDDDNNNYPDGMPVKTYNVESNDFQFDADGVWTGADQASPGNFISVNGVDYSRFYNPARETMRGFQPSHVSNTSVTEAGVDGLLRGPIGYKPDAWNNTYMVACWDQSETTTSLPSEPSCYIKMTDGKAFSPMTVTVANNAVTYYAMKDGLGQTAFDRSGKCVLNIYGVRDGVRSTPVSVTLGEGTSLGFDGISKWVGVNVESLGLCDYIYFQMESTAGNATPPYFCLINMTAWK